MADQPFSQVGGEPTDERSWALAMTYAEDCEGRSAEEPWLAVMDGPKLPPGEGVVVVPESSLSALRAERNYLAKQVSWRPGELEAIVDEAKREDALQARVEELETLMRDAQPIFGECVGMLDNEPTPPYVEGRIIAAQGKLQEFATALTAPGEGNDRA